MMLTLSSLNGFVCCDVNTYLLSDGLITFDYQIPDIECSLTFKLVMGTRVHLHSFTVCVLLEAYRPLNGCI